jgi:hypothetical protein
LLVGHTHEDVDAIIGKVLEKNYLCFYIFYILFLYKVLGGIRRKDMFTFPQYEEACGETLKSMNCRIISCRQLIGIPDYDEIFSDFNISNVQGLNDTKQLRIESMPDAGSVKFNYKFDCRKPGWFPRYYFYLMRSYQYQCEVS